MCSVLLRWAWSELSTDEVSASSKVSLYLISPSAGSLASSKVSLYLISPSARSLASSKVFLYLISPSAGVFCHSGAKDRICDGVDVGVMMSE